MRDDDRNDAAPAASASDEERQGAGPGRQLEVDRPSTVGTADDAELSVPYWLTSTEEAANTTFLRMVRRLPRLLREAWLLAWQASPATTAAVLILQLAAGVASAVGLLDLTTRVELSTFDDPEWRDAMERARDRGIDAAQRVVDHSVELITSIIGLAAAAGVLAVLHPVLLPLLVLAVVPTGWAAVRSARLGYRTVLRLIAVWRRQRMLTYLLAAREPAPELRAFTVRDYLLDEVRRLIRRSTREQIRVSNQQIRTNLVGQGLGGLATGLAYAALIGLLITGRMDLAVGGAAAYAINVGIGKLTELTHAVNFVYEQGLYFADYQGFCDLSGRRAEPAPNRIAPRQFTEIQLDGVTFSYPDTDKPAVNDVTMTLRRGEVIALVGENGSGKSTLAALLGGLYRPQQGTVRWDGVDASAFHPDTIRERVSVVMQEPTRWPFTARANITIGRHDRTVEIRTLHEAARAGDAHDFVMELPRRYDTMLSRHFTDGADLSGGQWQRLAVSRAFYRDAPLLICDEPTANLDARAEHDVYRRLRELAAGRTVVLITHRMASVREADRIYVLDHGTVVEQGDHEGLMSADGLYAQLFRLQASAYQSA